MDSEMVRKILDCPSLPTLPSVAIEVLRLARDPDVDMHQMAEVIGRDSALAGKILKTVNSVFYSPRHPVATLSRAVVVLGTQAVRTLTLGFSLVRSLRNAETGDFDLREYWQRSVYSSVAARLLATEAGMKQSEEAFVAALLQDVGMLGIRAALEEEYDALHAEAGDHESLPEAETAAWGVDHAVIGAKMAESWSLPSVLVAPIAWHHCPRRAPEDLRPIAEVVCTARLVARVFIGEQPGAYTADARDAAEAYLGMGPDEFGQLLQSVCESVEEVAALFEVSIGSAEDNDRILAEAREALLELALGAQIEVKELHEQQAELEVAAKTDGLTGLYPRAYLHEVLRQLFQESQASGTDLSVLFLDADHFKEINDTCGHAAGDEALRQIARIVSDTCCDLAFRYGGDEIVCLLPGADLHAAAEKAESIRKAVESETIGLEGQLVPVTVSIGLAIMANGVGFASPEQLLRAADRALYAAMNGGRNTVRIQVPHLTSPCPVPASPSDSPSPR